ncbi:uroporphyrin-III C-methyltransferase [Robiginitalea myxolifaciens]|uniref:uroporphyrinogen-III C-methyltransferase n=1 Tax=Robiginitalea myxolifaciens TaxID=400055 RepID=A0A1I6FRN6_9FLAO|nr:uroporphyrinogen-III C-methyltransferase [Robiginitalea myxolifaciens]SFR32620.1 uroporphyrin-III C-methyltransferase [Robiginitalea myxolifaciens]
MHKPGILSLIGAGPGDPELITLKGVRLLGEADVVLYDALASDQLLQYAPQAEHIYVGKRKGCASYLQEQINDLILQRGAQGKHVVRLKGGDPFVFGRGGEEMVLAAAAGMEVRVIPGISSSLAVPASENIPLTQRGISESFWVVTGTTKEHKLSRDVALAAQSSATVVILMGMSKLQKIMACFQAAGKSAMPVAVLQEGTTKRARRAFGTVTDIAAKVAEQGLGNPAVIVIGEVVRYGLPEYARELARVPQPVQI